MSSIHELRSGLKRFSVRPIATALILAIGIRALVQGLKDPLGSLAIEAVDFVIASGFVGMPLAHRVINWLFFGMYVTTGLVVIALGIWSGSRIAPPKIKPRSKQGP